MSFVSRSAEEPIDDAGEIQCGVDQEQGENGIDRQFDRRLVQIGFDQGSKPGPGECGAKSRQGAAQAVTFISSKKCYCLALVGKAGSIITSQSTPVLQNIALFFYPLSSSLSFASRKSSN